MNIRTSLLGGAALAALLALALAPAAEAKTHHHRVRHADGVDPAQERAVLKGEVEALESEVQALEAWKNEEAADKAQTQAQVQQLQGQLADATARADRAQAAVDAEIKTIPGTVKSEVASATPKPGWWANTSVSGRMYYDFTNIDEKSDVGNTGLNLTGNGGHPPNGTNFDIKRFYVSVDHNFNSMFSGDITTDVTYDSSVGATQIYIKKAYLQAKFSNALIVRLGAADLPWVPFDEDTYGYRYVENTLIDRAKFGTSADWGIHALGTLPIGKATLGYQVSAINGMGYKKPGFIGGVNRSEGVDFEGRINLNYNGFVAAIGGYDGKLGQDFSGVTTFHNAERFDALLAYSNKMFRIGGEYMWANADVASSQITTVRADDSEGWEIFGNVNLTPQIAVFGRYDWVKPRKATAPTLVNNYYNIGIQYEPVKIVDFALVYKHDTIDHGAFGDQNFATNANNVHGTYDEVGLWGQFRW
jgi:hypothetical protein